MKYAIIDSNNFPTAFYDDAVHTADQIPKQAIQITNDQWAECLANQGLRKLVSGKLVVVSPVVVAVNVAQVSDTQFIQALAESKYAIISWDEAYNWGGQGQLPQILIAALDKITDTDTRNRAYMKARSAKSYIYSDKWVQSILALLPEEVVAKMPGTDAQDKLQQLFNFAATL